MQSVKGKILIKNNLLEAETMLLISVKKIQNLKKKNQYTTNEQVTKNTKTDNFPELIVD